MRRSVINSRGRFVWYELITTDVSAAKAFYTTVMGWGAWDASIPGRPYTFFIAGNVPAGGAMEFAEDARKSGATPTWIGYIQVDDVDATADRVSAPGWSRARPADRRCRHQPLFGLHRSANRAARVAQMAQTRPRATCRAGCARPRRLARATRRRLGAGMDLLP